MAAATKSSLQNRTFQQVKCSAKIHVGHVVQNGRSVLSLYWHELVFMIRQGMKDLLLWASVVVVKNFRCRLADNAQLHVQHSTHIFLFQPIIVLICGAVLASLVIVF